MGNVGRFKNRKSRVIKVKEVKKVKKLRRGHCDTGDIIDTILGLTAFAHDINSKKLAKVEIQPPV